MIKKNKKSTLRLMKCIILKYIESITPKTIFIYTLFVRYELQLNDQTFSKGIFIIQVG